jgi:hypothetical protein
MFLGNGIPRNFQFSNHRLATQQADPVVGRVILSAVGQGDFRFLILIPHGPVAKLPTSQESIQPGLWPF